MDAEKLTVEEIYLLALRQILLNQSYSMKDNEMFHIEARECVKNSRKLAKRIEQFLAEN